MSANLENSTMTTGLEKGQFSFQSQRRAMSKNVQTTIHLGSFHILARLCSKSFKLGFSRHEMEYYSAIKRSLTICNNVNEF